MLCYGQSPVERLRSGKDQPAPTFPPGDSAYGYPHRGFSDSAKIKAAIG